MRFACLSLVAVLALAAAAPIAEASPPSDSSSTMRGRSNGAVAPLVGDVSSPELRFERTNRDTVTVAADLSVESSAPSDERGGARFPIEFALAGLATAKTGGRKTAAKTGAAKNAADSPAPTPSTSPAAPAATSNKEFEEARAADRKATTGSDKTEPGGRYIGADGVARNAQGEVLDEKKK